LKHCIVHVLVSEAFMSLLLLLLYNSGTLFYGILILWPVAGICSEWVGFWEMLE